MADKNISDMSSIYLVAAELSKKGFAIASFITDDPDTDMLISDQDEQRAYTVKVKTYFPLFKCWLLGKNRPSIKSRNHIYVFIYIEKNKNEFFIVPSRVVSEMAVYRKKNPARKYDSYSIYRETISKYENKWSLFTGKSRTTRSSTRNLEKRAHNRLELRLPVNLYRTEAGQSNLHATTINISTGGVYFETTADTIKTGDELALEFGVLSSDNHFPQEAKIATISKVIRVMKIHKKRIGSEGDSTCYGIASRFLKPLKLTY